MTFRLFAALLALVLLGALSATAGAAVLVKHERKSPEEIAAYWSKARMQGAKPVQRVKPGGGGGGGGGKAAASFLVPEPYLAGAERTNGKLFFTLGGVDYQCSGTAASSTTAGVNLVWTAGHCVADSASALASNFDFVPAYKNGAAPFGHWTGSTSYTTSQWLASNDFDFDLGAVRVTRAGMPGATFASADVGTRPVVTAQPDRQQYRSYGYPAEGKFNGQLMWGCASGLLRRDGTRPTAPMAITCDMTGGSSGGGWITSAGGIASVNSYGYQNQKTTMYGPYQGAVARDLYDRAR